MTKHMIDPVCGMQVSPNSFSLEHLGIRYAFCSQQCQDRFKANPHLYIGVPGEKAAKQKGLEVIKQRRFRLDRALNNSQAAMLKDELNAMMGIKHIEVTGNTVVIRYDLLQATAEQIESRIGQIGLQLGIGWAERLQRGFVHFLEETEVDSLELQPKPGQPHSH